MIYGSRKERIPPADGATAYYHGNMKSGTTAALNVLVEVYGTSPILSSLESRPDAGLRGRKVVEFQIRQPGKAPTWPTLIR
jgi:hypothetical protein